MTNPPQMMRSIHMEQDIQYTTPVSERTLSCTSCGLGYEPAEHSQVSRGQQSPGRTISLFAPELSTTYTQAAGASLSARGAIISCFSAAASCYAVHWRKLCWFCRFPRKFSDSAHSGSPQYLPLSPPCVVRHLVDCPAVRHFRHPTIGHCVVMSVYLIFHIGPACPSPCPSSSR